MSIGCEYLHSHSGIEIEVRLPKQFVLVDEKYENLFKKSEPYVYNNKMYLKVSITEFVEMNGVFKYLRK